MITLIVYYQKHKVASGKASLIAMIGKWRWNLGKGGSCDALLTDLSKAFECIVHDFLTAKLEAYSFTHEALNVVKNCLSYRRDRRKMNDSYSSFLDLLIGVPQGSLLGPFLFNFYICNLFFFIEEDTVTSYVDETTPFSNRTNVLTILNGIKTKHLIFLIGFRKTTSGKSWQNESFAYIQPRNFFKN